MTFAEEYYYAKRGEWQPKLETGEYKKETGEYKKETGEYKKETGDKASSVLYIENKQKINIELNDYFGYEIDLNNGEFTAIRFEFNNKKYRIYFNYEERNESSDIIISNLELQEKVRCGYGELKCISGNEKFIDFIKEVLTNYGN